MSRFFLFRPALWVDPTWFSIFTTFGKPKKTGIKKSTVKIYLYVFFHPVDPVILGLPDGLRPSITFSTTVGLQFVNAAYYVVVALWRSLRYIWIAWIFLIFMELGTGTPMREIYRRYLRMYVAEGVRRFKRIPNEIAVKSLHTNLFHVFTLYFSFFFHCWRYRR